jgi:hypothetical protein
VSALVESNGLLEAISQIEPAGGIRGFRDITQ